MEPSRARVSTLTSRSFALQVCKENVAVLKEYNLRGRDPSKHRKLDDNFRGSDRKKLGEQLQTGLVSQQQLFHNAVEDTDAAVAVGYVVSGLIAKAGKPLTEGPFLKDRMLWVACIPGLKKKSLATLSADTVAEQAEGLSHNIYEQLQDKAQSFSAFSVPHDESPDATDTAQLAICIRGVDDSFVCYYFKQCVFVNLSWFWWCWDHIKWQMNAEKHELPKGSCTFSSHSSRPSYCCFVGKARTALSVVAALSVGDWAEIQKFLVWVPSLTENWSGSRWGAKRLPIALEQGTKALNVQRACQGHITHSYITRFMFGYAHVRYIFLYTACIVHVMEPIKQKQNLKNTLPRKCDNTMWIFGFILK